MKAHSKAIAVTGMTGVGKDFLVERANAEHGITVVNWGTLLGEELREDRDVMMDVTDARRIRVGQFAVCRRILHLQPVAVTCHTVRPDDQGGFAYDPELEAAFNPAAYVFVTAPPETIYERVRQRNERGERKSRELSVPEIGEIQATKLSAVHELAGQLGCKMLVVENTDGNVERSVRQISDEIAAIVRPAMNTELPIN